MSSRILPIVLILAATCLGLLGCRNTTVKIFDQTIAGGSGAQDLRPLRYGAAHPVVSFDPNGEAGWCEATALLHARLFTVDPEGRVVPDLVQDAAVFDEGRRWELILRKELRFHDGVTVTAADVVTTFKRVIEDEDSPAGRTLAHLAAVRALDAHRVEMRVDRPSPELPERLTRIAILPAHRLAEGRAAFEANPVGAGPYRHLAHEEGVVFFAAHGDHHLGRPRTEWLTLIIIEDERRRAEALSDGIVDLARVDPDSLPLLGDVGRFRLQRCATGDIGALRLDVTAPGLSDPRVRRALGALIPRDRLVAEGLSGYGRPAWQLFDQRSLAFDEAAASPWMSPEAAAEQLDAAGWRRSADGRRVDSAGRRLSVRLVAPSREGVSRRAAPLIVEAWRAAGIEARVISGNVGDAVSGEAHLETWNTLFAPLDTLEARLGSSGVHTPPGFRDEAVDAALSAAGQTEALTARVEGVRAAQARGLEQAPWLPLYAVDALFVTHRDVLGFEFAVVPDGPEFSRHLWRLGISLDDMGVPWPR